MPWRIWQRYLMVFIIGFMASDGTLNALRVSKPNQHVVLVTPVAPHAYTRPPPHMTLHGRVIQVDITLQHLWAYQNGVVIFETAVTTGQPGLATPTGTYMVMSKLTDTWFTSAWPQGSSYYYAPELVHYGLAFRAGGFYIHDAAWRHAFGPATNKSHVDPDGAHETGSHGCVEVTTAASAWLYHWAPVGTVVLIIAS